MTVLWDCMIDWYLSCTVSPNPARPLFFTWFYTQANFL
ncbi:hypothetical protein AO379_1680 [Moraxella catarrhalis]|nr:hypothetical protein AO379_1680 [Moraxella catarrhalis]